MPKPLRARVCPATLVRAWSEVREMSQSEDAESSGGMDRRKVLKGAVAAGAGAVVWAEPTIRGLARRPAYAAAGTPQTFVVPSTSWRKTIPPPASRPEPAVKGLPRGRE